MENKHLSAIPIIASDGRSITEHIKPFYFNAFGSPKYWMQQESGTYTPLPGNDDIKRHLLRGGAEFQVLHPARTIGNPGGDRSDSSRETDLLLWPTRRIHGWFV